jgi:SPP1 gp7 family putative phage head morphogenesis protein
MPRRKNNKKNRIQLAIEFDEFLKILEDKFIIKLSSFFDKKKKAIIKESQNLDLFSKAISKDSKNDLPKLKKMMKNYYQKIGKETISKTNEEIKELSGKSSRIKIPDINEGLRYRAEQLAKQKLKDYRDELKEKVLKLDGTKKDKNDIVKEINRASKVFQNKHITLVARMESVTVANQQRLEVFKKSSIIKGVQFLAVMDKRTTQICISRHKMVLKLDDSNLPNFTPPCHFNCRSLLSPVTIFEENIEFTQLKDIENLPNTQWQDIELRENRKRDLVEINKLRVTQAGQLSSDELVKIVKWEVDNAKNILAYKKDFEPYFIDIKKFNRTTKGKLERTIADVESRLIKIEEILKQKDLIYKDIFDEYSNIKGKIRELQISHKLMLDKNIKILSISEDLIIKKSSVLQEVDIKFQQKEMLCIGEIKATNITEGYFREKINEDDKKEEQGARLLQLSLENNYKLVFFVDKEKEKLLKIISNLDFIKLNPNLDYDVVDSKAFLENYPFF